MLFEIVLFFHQLFTIRLFCNNKTAAPKINKPVVVRGRGVVAYFADRNLSVFQVFILSFNSIAIEKKTKVKQNNRFRHQRHYLASTCLQ